jgi:hypothetical protein
VVAEVKSAPAAPRLVARVIMRHSSKQVARQKMARQKVARQKMARQKVAQHKIARQKGPPQKVIQPKLVRVAVNTATVCTGNWVNAACAAP